LRRRGRATRHNGGLVILIARFVLSSHSAKIAMTPDFSKVEP